MAELDTADQESTCCIPEGQAACCEPEQKADCCGEDGGGCGCAEGAAEPAGDAALRDCRAWAA